MTRISRRVSEDPEADSWSADCFFRTAGESVLIDASCAAGIVTLSSADDSDDSGAEYDAEPSEDAAERLGEDGQCAALVVVAGRVSSGDRGASSPNAESGGDSGEFGETQRRATA
jgi:hypothetical protein